MRLSGDSPVRTKSNSSKKSRTKSDAGVRLFCLSSPSHVQLKPQEGATLVCIKHFSFLSEQKIKCIVYRALLRYVERPNNLRPNTYSSILHKNTRIIYNHCNNLYLTLLILIEIL